MMGIETVLDSVEGKLPWETDDNCSGDPVETRDDLVFDEERLLADEERLLTDEERLLAAIHMANGRIWQSMLCEELDWEKSKVSRQLTQLQAEGKISKYRVGRQNAICLPEHEPDIVSRETTRREANPK